MTVARLAQASGLTKGFISQVETGHSNPSIESLSRIARALDLTLSGLLGDEIPSGVSTADMTTAKIYKNSDATGVPNTLVPVGTVDGLCGYNVRLLPGATVRNGADTAKGMTNGGGLAFVLDGQVTFASDGVEADLTTRDSACWRARESFRLVNQTDSTATLLMVLGPGAARPVVSSAARTINSALTSGSEGSERLSGALRLVAMRAERNRAING
jgi:DNA-binding XRE family transcriptional regulator